jgi:hypothetical protein
VKRRWSSDASRVDAIQSAVFRVKLKSLDASNVALSYGTGLCRSSPRPTERPADETLSLPLYPGMTVSQQRQVADAIARAAEVSA